MIGAKKLQGGKKKFREIIAPPHQNPVYAPDSLVIFHLLFPQPIVYPNHRLPKPQFTQPIV